MLCEFDDVAHAARRLHCAQSRLRAWIAEIQLQLGDRVILIDHRSVWIDPELRRAIGERVRLSDRRQDGVPPKIATGKS